MQIEIKSDPFFVVQRLKELDGGYYVVFDTKKQKYVLNNKFQIDNHYCLTYPHKELDFRMLELAQKTSTRNMQSLLEEIEQTNNILKEELWQQNK